MRKHYTALIKQEAKRLGFSHCGMSAAAFLEEEAPRLEKWLKSAMHGSMKYMENHFEKRLDPTKLVPGAKSVISLLYNYFPTELQKTENTPKVSKYAYGMDYHWVIKAKLKQLMTFIQKEIGDVQGRVFVDSAPVLERAWAAKSGLGWIGKNSHLISKRTGSFYFISEVMLDLDLDYSVAATDHCGSCTACIDACPTQAITAPYQIDSKKCISYLTIELKDQIPNDFKDKMEGWIFGCDICQDVCPWNRFSKPQVSFDLNPNKETPNLSWKEWEEITDEVFKKRFDSSALKRAGLKKIKNSLLFQKKIESAKRSPAPSQQEMATERGIT